MIKSNSFSRLEIYKLCPLYAKLKYVDKLKEPERPPSPNNTTEHANDRGSRIHNSADDYINGRCSNLIPELHSFKTEFANARLVQSANPELVLTEQLWTSKKDWTSTNAEVDKNPYLRVIIDLLLFTNNDKSSARVIDFKTGKSYGNEVKHASQLQLYIVAAFMRFPELQEVSAEIWYLDKATKPKITKYTRDQAMRFRKFWDKRMETMCTDTEFKAKPHVNACMFCPYGKTEHSNKWVNKSGDCQESLDKRFL